MLGRTALPPVICTGRFTSSGDTQVGCTYIANSTDSGVDTLVLVDFDNTLGPDARIWLTGQHTFNWWDFQFIS